MITIEATLVAAKSPEARAWFTTANGRFWSIGMSRPQVAELAGRDGQTFLIRIEEKGQ